MRFIKLSMMVSAVSGLLMFGLNFSNPEKKSSGKRPSLMETAQKPIEKRYVRIDGKIFEYNPRNVYNVNGTSTFFKPSRQEDYYVRPEATQAQNGQADSQNLQRVQKMVDRGAISAYSPGGMDTIMKGAIDAKQKADERQRALNQLMKMQ